MGKTTAQVLIEEGEERGIIRAKQEDLLEQMQVKFTSVPQPVVEKIKSTRELDQLNRLIRQIITANSIDEMGIE